MAVASKLLPRRRRDETGAAAVLMSVLLVSGLLFGVGAMTVDLGQMYDIRREAQTAADLGATAGGGLLQTDPQGACQAAVTYLRENIPRGIDLASVPAPGACTSTGQTPANLVDTNGDGTPDTQVVTTTATSLRVVVPRTRVQFGFATALGFSSSSVTAGATVELRSYGGGIGPFAIPAGCLASTPPQWYFKVKDGPKSNPGDGSCTDPANGSFGWLDIQRAGKNAGSNIGPNVHYGADHPIGFVPGIDPNYLKEATSTAPLCTGTISTSGGPVTFTPVPDNAGPYALPQMPNCLPIEDGNISSISDDLVGKKSTCAGRLNDLDGPGGNKSRTFDPCPINGHPLQDYLTTGATLTDVQTGVAGSLSYSIVDSPNFFVVPIVFSTGRPKTTAGSDSTPVVGYRGVYLDCYYLTPTCTNEFGNATKGTAISELDGYVFNLSTISPPPNGGPDVQDYYTGAGVAVPVLVRDPLN